MAYVDGYVLPIKKTALRKYLPMAQMGERIWMKHGALDYKECVGDDMKPKWGTPFGKLTKSRPGETVVFAFVVFKSRAHRDRVNAKVMKEMMAGGMPPEMPFDVRRMAYGGFKTIVDGGRKSR